MKSVSSKPQSSEVVAGDGETVRAGVVAAVCQEALSPGSHSGTQRGVGQWRCRGGWFRGRHTRNVSEQKRPDVRSELRGLLEWYREVLGRIEAGAIVEPGEAERLREEASLVDELLGCLERTHEPAS
jgi:hypothetical protein